MGDIGRRQVRFEVLPLAGGRQVGPENADADVAGAGATRAFDAGSAEVLADVDVVGAAPEHRRAGARTEPARS